MAVKLVHHPASDTILVLSGYEGGLTAVHQLPPGSNSSVTPAQLIYLSQPHTQPILSLDVSPDARTYYTSGADAVIAAHRVPELPSSAGRINITEAATSPPSSTSSPGILPEAQTTATPVQPQPSPIIPPPPPISFPKQATSTPTPHKPAGLSSLLSSTQPQPQTKYHPSRSPPQVKPVPPHRSTNTKHSGQQSLRVRSDDRLLVTGGWDTRVRIYSTKTLKEVGVLKWHKQGVYAVDFASVLAREDVDKGDEVGAGEVEKRETGLGKLQRQREKDVQTRHWVVAGGKDGKVSLWEVF
jgi:WD40 repeat protein